VTADKIRGGIMKEKCNVQKLKDCIGCENYRSLHYGISKYIKAVGKECAWIDCSLGMSLEFYNEGFRKGQLIRITK
jgi:hypothetical protein